MSVLVVRSSGFLGRSVLPILSDRGHEVFVLTRSQTSADRVVALGARAVPGDVADQPSLALAMGTRRYQGLVCLLPLSSCLGPAVVAAGEQASIEREVFVSITAVFTTLDASTTPARMQAESAIRAGPLAWTIIRPTMIYGAPGDRYLERLLWLFQPTAVVPLPIITGRQQPVHVRDCAETVVAALERPISVGRCYQVADPNPLSLREMVAQAAAASSRRLVLVPVPYRPLAVLARWYGAWLAIPGSGPNSSPDWPRTRRSTSTRHATTFGYNPRRLPTESRKRPHSCLPNELSEDKSFAHR